MGQRERAVQDFGEAITLDPRNTVAHHTRGSVHAELGQLDLAIQDFDDAIGIDSRNVAAYSKRAAAYVELGRLESAVHDYDEIIRIDREDAEAFNGRGAAYAALGQLERAVQDLDRAVVMDRRNNDDALNNRGTVYVELGEYERAVKDFDLVIAREPRYEFLQGKAESLGKAAQYQRALVDLKEALQLNAHMTRGYENRAGAYALMGRDADSKADADSVERLAVEAGALRADIERLQQLMRAQPPP